MADKKALTALAVVCLFVFLLASCVNTGTDADKLTVTFETGVEGVVVAPLKAAAGAQISPPVSPVRAGYRFEGWQYEGNPYAFSVMPAADITLTAQWTRVFASLHIDLQGAGGQVFPLDLVDRENYVSSTVRVEDAYGSHSLDAVPAEFRGRGHGSWDSDKRGYRIKFASRQPLLGNPPSRHWVILACVNFGDTTLARNSIAFGLAREVFDAVEYTTSAKWADVYVNGAYRGVYLVCEHVRADSDRVDIPVEFGVADTGYLVEYDAYAAGTEGIHYFRVPGVKYPFTVKSPDPDDYLDEGITAAQYRAQVSYIQSHVTNVYTAALSKNFAAFSQYADVDSFVDMYILHEYLKNTDTGWSSFFLYKRPGEKLRAGPAWDFDASAGVSRGDSSPEGIYVAGSAQLHSPETYSHLFVSLMDTPGFKAAVVARWKVLSPRITAFAADALSDAFIAQHSKAMGKNFVRWNYDAPGIAERNWARDTEALRQWLLQRALWLDTEWR